MSEEIIPWFYMHDYPAIKQLCAQDPAVPSTFQEWEIQINSWLECLAQSGHAVHIIGISREEIAEFCMERGLTPSLFYCKACAIHKSSSSALGL